MAGDSRDAQALRRERVRVDSVADCPEDRAVFQHALLGLRLAVDPETDLLPAIAIHLVDKRRLIEQELAEQAGREQRLVLVSGCRTPLEVLQCLKEQLVCPHLHSPQPLLALQSRPE
jgi:hypothetical protein